MPIRSKLKRKFCLSANGENFQSWYRCNDKEQTSAFQKCGSVAARAPPRRYGVEGTTQLPRLSKRFIYISVMIQQKILQKRTNIQAKICEFSIRHELFYSGFFLFLHRSCEQYLFACISLINTSIPNYSDNWFSPLVGEIITYLILAAFIYACNENIQKYAATGQIYELAGIKNLWSTYSYLWQRGCKQVPTQIKVFIQVQVGKKIPKICWLQLKRENQITHHR